MDFLSTRVAVDSTEDCRGRYSEKIGMAGSLPAQAQLPFFLQGKILQSFTPVPKHGQPQLLYRERDTNRSHGGFFYHGEFGTKVT